MATTTGVFLPDEQDQQIPKQPAQSMRANGDGHSQSTLPLPSASELKKLDEEELKAAIKSAWKKHERIAKKDMGPLLYWLREKLRAQGSRNDLRDQDKGFGAWVEENLDVTRRTADSWADAYAVANGLRERKPTYGNASISSEAHPDDDFHAAELRKHGRMIQINYWVSQKDHKQYEQALKTIKTHFKIANDKEAVMKGVQYAGQAIARGLRAGNHRKRTSATGR